MPSKLQTSDANSTNTLVLPASADKIHWLHFSYSDDPTNGKLTIKSGETAIYELNITSGGAGPLAFTPALEGRDLSLVMTAGGDGIISKMNVRYS